MGSTVDSKLINIFPKAVTMCETHIIVCSDSEVYSWYYMNKRSQALNTFDDRPQSHREVRKMGREMAWFIEEKPKQDQIYDRETYQVCQNIENPVFI